MACLRNLFIMVFLSLAPYAAQAQSGGLHRVTSVLSHVQTALTAVKVITVTIAILWVGYKVLFNGQTLRECAPILIGAILIGGAAEIASLLVAD